MAVETTATSASFIGTGVSSTYAPGFYVNSSDQVKVYLNGVLKTLGDDYVVNNVGAASGCSIVATFTLGATVYIERVTPITQLVDTQNNETILEDVLDAAFDKLTMISQELDGKVARAPLMPKGETGYQFPAAASRVNKVFGFDAVGAAALLAITGGVISDAAAVTYLASFTGAVARSAASKMQEFPSVKDAGAKGDNATNDTAALAVAVANSKYLRWPAGTYLVDNLPSPPAGCIWVADGEVIIKRRATSTANTLVVFTGACQVEGITFDGNKAANSNACNAVTVTSTVSLFMKCKFINSKVVAGGYGSGLMIDSTTAPEDSDHALWNCEAYGNDVDGFSGQNVRGLEAIGNMAHDNGVHGFHFDNYDTSFVKKLFDCRVIGNYAYNNGATGIYFGNSLQNNVVGGTPVYGWATNYESYRVIIEGNICRNNGYYGIAAQGLSFNISNNIANNNSTLVAWAGGILLNANNSTVSNNTVENNKFGIDAGGSALSVIANNFVVGNSVSGINCGGSQYVQVLGNLLTNNGGTTGAQVDVHNVETDANGVALPLLCNNTLISGNLIGQATTNFGIFVHDGCTAVKITNNQFVGSDVNRFLICIANDCTISGNLVDGGVSRLITPTGGGVLSVPDCFDFFFTNSATTITSLDFYSANTWVGRGGVGYVAITAGGTGYTGPFAVTFTGGGGTGATGTAYVRNGVVIGVRMTNYGTGYTSAPTPVFTAGGGTGATGTAALSVPLAAWRELEVYTNTACTIDRGGVPVIENKGAVNLTMAARDAARLKSFFGQWNVMSRAA